MVEKEMLTTKIEDNVSEWIVLWLQYILPKIQELESKQVGDWISVEEQLPSFCDWGWSPTVLTCDSEWMVRENCYFYWNEEEDGEWREDEVEIIAWQPLPLPVTK